VVNLDGGQNHFSLARLSSSCLHHHTRPDTFFLSTKGVGNSCLQVPPFVLLSFFFFRLFLLISPFHCLFSPFLFSQFRPLMGLQSPDPSLHCLGIPHVFRGRVTSPLCRFAPRTFVLPLFSLCCAVLMIPFRHLAQPLLDSYQPLYSWM